MISHEKNAEPSKTYVCIRNPTLRHIRSSRLLANLSDSKIDVNLPTNIVVNFIPAKELSHRSYRTEDPEFESRLGVRFLGIYT
jgi:hypothetical protein